MMRPIGSSFSDNGYATTVHRTAAGKPSLRPVPAFGSSTVETGEEEVRAPKNLSQRVSEGASRTYKAIANTLRGGLATLASRKPAGRYSPAELDAFAEQIRTQGYVVLKGHFPKQKVADWNRKWHEIMMPTLEAVMKSDDKNRMDLPDVGPRGPMRYYTRLPFYPPFNDPAIYADPDVLGIVERLIGKDFVMSQLAADTPFKGSKHQKWHSDTDQVSPLAKNKQARDPNFPFQLALNFPLVDVTPENGPFEIVPGTRTWSHKEQKQYIADGKADLNKKALLMETGDLMIRDVRTIHRGTPNMSDAARPMIVIGYNPRWHNRDELEYVNIPILKEQLRQIPWRARRMLDINHVYKRVEDVPPLKYKELTFLKMMMGLESTEPKKKPND